MRQQAIRVFIGYAVLAAVAIAVVWHFAAAPVVETSKDATVPSPVAGSVAVVPKPATTPTPMDAAAHGLLTPRPIRDVTPQGMARVYLMPGDTRPATPSTSIRITRAAAAQDGTISGDGGTVRLYGVALPDERRICAAASGERWPCGRRAYISLHNKVVMQTINCAPRAFTEPPAADCFLGEVNLAAWIIGQGLARVSSNVGDKDLIAAEAAARGAKRGLWADPREAAMTAPGP